MTDAAQLTERIENGTLQPARLSVAAYLGHADAAAALGARAPTQVDTEQAEAWVKGWLPWVEPVYNMALTRLHVATARSILHLWEKAVPDDDRPHKAIEAAEGWILNPTPEVAWEVRKTVEPLMGLLGPIAIGGDLLLGMMTTAPEPERTIFQKTAMNGAMAAVALAAGAASHPAIDVTKLLAGKIPREAAFGIELALSCLPPKPTYTTLWNTWLEAARRELIPWATGEGDPVRERAA